MARVAKLAAAALALALLAAPAARAATADKVPEALDWSFDGVFGQFDRGALQRGLQVYLEVCAACHSLDLVAYRNLLDLGYSEDEVKAIAADFEVTDGPDEFGDFFERAALPADRFVAPFANANAARAANGGALPPDLSLMAKAHPDGPDYIVALLAGYEDAPDDFELGEGMDYNPFFAGSQIAMPPPLSDDLVEYADGTPATVAQMSRDVAHFLTWAAEPTLELRKRTGVKVVLFLLVLSAVLYAAKRKMWANLH